MNSQDNQDNELRQRERELQERDHQIRLREIEAEIIAFLHQVRYIFRAETITEQGLVVPHQSRKCYRFGTPKLP